MSSICDSCHAGCCRTYRLIITVFDFFDLAASLGLKTAVDGITFEASPLNLNYRNNSSMMFPFIFDDENRKGQMHHLALKRDESTLFPKTLKCNFLKEEYREEPLENAVEHPGNKVKAYCSVYENRPIMCRTYPIGLNTQNYISFLKRREDLPQAESTEAYKICPKSSLTLEDFGLTEAKAKLLKNNEMLLNNVRTQAHNRISDDWNLRQNRLSKDFVPFIMNYANSLILEEKIQQTPGITTAVS